MAYAMVGQAEPGSNCLVHDFKVAGSTCDALGYLTPSRTPSVTHQVTLCLIRLCGNGWPREPHASKRRPHPPPPRRRSNSDLQGGPNSCRRLHRTSLSLKKDDPARAACAMRIGRARGFRSRSMLPWEAWGEAIVGRHGRSEAGGHPWDSTSEPASKRRASPLTGNLPGSRCLRAVWVHVFPSTMAAPPRHT